MKSDVGAETSGEAVREEAGILEGPALVAREIRAWRIGKVDEAGDGIRAGGVDLEADVRADEGFAPVGPVGAGSVVG